MKYIHAGVALSSFPSDLRILADVVVEYETHPGWKSDISKCRTFDSLPLNARKYIERIEAIVGVRVEWIGVGPGRDAMIHRPL